MTTAGMVPHDYLPYCSTCGPEVLFETCVATKFVDDDDDSFLRNIVTYLLTDILTHNQLEIPGLKSNLLYLVRCRRHCLLF